MIDHVGGAGERFYSSDKEEQVRGDPDSDWECADIEHDLVKRMVLPIGPKRNDEGVQRHRESSGSRSEKEY